MPVWLSTLGAVAVRPRQTLRRILEQPRDRMIVPLVLLAAASLALHDVRFAGIRRAFETHAPMRLSLVAGAILLGIVVVALLHLVVFYVLSWIAFGVGRYFEGSATIRDVRSAVAWGLAPIIWALVWRVPIALFAPMPPGGPNFQIGGAHLRVNPGMLASGCGPALAVGILDLAVFVWYFAITSATLAEAHRFSGGRGFATLCLSLLSPLIIAAAAVIVWR